MANSAVVQSAVGSNGTGATTVAATWGASTQPGSVLFAMIGVNLAGSGSISFTIPTGWAKIDDQSNGTTVQSAMFIRDSSTDLSGEWENVSRSGTETWTLSASRKACIILIEVQGLRVSTSQRWNDPTGAGYSSNTGSSTTAGNLTTGNVSKLPVDYGIAHFAAAGTATWSAPTTGWTLVNQTFSSGGGAAGTKVTVAATIGEVNGVGTDVGQTLTLSASSTWVWGSFNNGGTYSEISQLGIGV